MLVFSSICMVSHILTFRELETHRAGMTSIKVLELLKKVTKVEEKT